MEKKKAEIKIEGKTDYIFAIFLIFVGIVLLLNTTGLVDWGVWSILWKFWPLIIVFAGLNLVFEGSRILSIVLGSFSFVVLIFVFIWSVALLDVQDVDESWNIRVPEWFDTAVESKRNISSNYFVSGDEFTGVQKKEIVVDMGVGTLNVSNDSLEDHLSLDADYFSNFGEPDLNVKTKDDSLLINLDLGKQGKTFMFNTDSPLYSLILGTDQIPTDLEIKVGAGKSEVVLKNYSLDSLNVELGAGDMRIVFSDMLLKNFEVDAGVGNFVLELGEDSNILEPVLVKVGAGKATLTLPEGMEYKITGNLGIGAIKTPIKSISGVGNDFKEIKSEGYDFGENRIEIVVDVGVGEFILN